MRAAAPPGLQVSVRRFTPEDRAFVAALSERAFAEYGRTQAPYTLSVIDRPDTGTWLGVEGDVPIGLLVLELRGSHATILAVAVTESARGRGIGQRLMQ